eukprot:COSAG05_NODE_14381_length_398_cov_1.030100_2_plen_35_part_01
MFSRKRTEREEILVSQVIQIKMCAVDRTSLTIAID